MGCGSWATVILLCASMPLAAQPLAAQQQGAAAPAPNQAAPDRDHPSLSHRPAPAPGSPEGAIKLDVLVTDDGGRPVAGLEQKDFTLLDNKKPRPILSFRAVDGILGAGQGEPPVEVILLIDAANTSLQRVAYARLQVQNYHSTEWRSFAPANVGPAPLRSWSQDVAKAIHRRESAGKAT
jgi:hypothetical protein